MIDQNTVVKRGDIWMVDLGVGEGSEQRGCKPCVVIQNDVGNKFSPTTVIIPITSKHKGFNKTHVLIQDTLDLPSYVLCEQIRVISKTRMVNKIGVVRDVDMWLVENTVKLQLGMGE